MSFQINEKLSEAWTWMQSHSYAVVMGVMLVIVVYWWWSQNAHASGSSSSCGAAAGGQSPKKSVRFADAASVELIFSPACGHCQRFRPVWEKTKAQYPHVLFKEVDGSASDSQKYVSSLRVDGFPTMIFRHGDKVVHRQAGAPPEDEWHRMMQELTK